MHIIVTRPEADAADLMQQLRGLGHTVVSSPLLTMRPTTVALQLDGVQAVIATSRNALRAIAETPHLDKLQRLPLFVVGPASARLARELGFGDVTAGDRGARELATAVAQSCQASGGAMLYLSGDEVAFDMPSALAETGFDVRRQVVYEAVQALQLPEAVRADIRDGKADAVVLMSPRTAKLFGKLTVDAGVAEQARGIVHLCLSPAVASAVGSSAKRVMVADRPSSEEMLALVKELASNHP